MIRPGQFIAGCRDHKVSCFKAFVKTGLDDLSKVNSSRTNSFKLRIPRRQKGGITSSVNKAPLIRDGLFTLF